MTGIPQTNSKASPPLAVQTQQWNGPLPPPAALEQFERVIPGSAERILRMAEQEQAHRMLQERTGLAAEIEDSRRGQWFGVTIGVLGPTGAVINSCLGGPWQASVALVGVPILGTVQAFIRGRRADG